MNHTAPRGYIGLIGLLLVVALIGFLFWRSDLFSPTPAIESTPDVQSGQNQYEQGIEAVNAAKNAKRQVEGNYQEQRGTGY